MAVADVVDGSVVTLGVAACQEAIRVGLGRHLPNVLRGRRDRVKEDQSPVQFLVNGINGAAAEIAAGLFLGLPAILSTDFRERKRGDLAGGHEVRGGMSGFLHLLPSDEDDRRAIYMYGQLPEFEAVGWIVIGDGKRADWLRRGIGGKLSFWVPRGKLKSFSEW
jgi:hypothetical protein